MYSIPMTADKKPHNAAPNALVSRHFNTATNSNLIIPKLGIINDINEERYYKSRSMSRHNV